MRQSDTIPREVCARVEVTFPTESVSPAAVTAVTVLVGGLSRPLIVGAFSFRFIASL